MPKRAKYQTPLFRRSRRLLPDFIDDNKGAPSFVKRMLNIRRKK